MLLVLVLSAPPGGELAPPFAVEARGGAIDVAGGNSAPCMADLDGDGLADLLVGQFQDGCLRVYRNVGARGKPRFEAFQLLRAADALATVPYG